MNDKKQLSIFLESFKEGNLETILKNLPKKNNENLNEYLIEKLLPTLFMGFEELSREVELLLNNDEINTELRERFNPCIFLAQYLMRNNPKN